MLVRQTLVQFPVPHELVLLLLLPHLDAGQLQGVHERKVGASFYQVNVSFQPHQKVAALVAEADAVRRPVQFQLPEFCLVSF